LQRWEKTVVAVSSTKSSSGTSLKNVPGKLAAPPKPDARANNGAMPHRDLHLACYDVGHPRRLVAALKLARRYATGGQKSVHELFLTAAERDTLVDEMRALLVLTEDRFLLLRLDPRSRLFTLGKAIAPADPDYFYIG
jgi:CRISPR-associated protein Cas2